MAVGVLGNPHHLDARYNLSSQIPDTELPVVFIGPYEHHSNELPWRESIADVVRIPEDGGRTDRTPPRSCQSPSRERSQ